MISKPIEIQNNAIKKLNEYWFKQFLRAFLAGIVVSLGYTGTLIIATSLSLDSLKQENIWQFRLLQWCGSFLFGVSVISCCVFGGSLYTGNCSGFLPCVHKLSKWRQLLKNLAITFVGNYLGTIFFAVLVCFTPSINKLENGTIVASSLSIEIVKLAISKITTPWWLVFLSSIGCNIVISLCIFSWICIDNKAASCITIILLVSVFFIAGYFHIVATMFLITLAGFITCLPVVSGAMPSFLPHMGQFFYNWMIPCVLGNTVGGFGIVILYFYANEYINKKKADKKETKVVSK